MRAPVALVVLFAACAHAPSSSAPAAPRNLACFEHEHGDGTGKCTGWRGGQPTEAELAALAVKSVLKLNLAVPEGRDHLPAGVEPLEHPWLPVGPVPHDDVLAALFDFERAPRPVYVHCTHGVDRTGLLIALYRVLVEHRPAALAWAEWRSFPRSSLDGLLYDAFERETGFHIPEGER